MGYDNTGAYTRAQNFSADASAGIKILAARVDAELDDFASAMALPLLRDGRNAATGDIPMGGNRLVNVGAPTSATNYIRAKDVIENVPIYMVDAETSADRISVSALFFTTASAATAPADGSHILIKAGSDKSSAVAIRLNTGDGNPHSAGVILSNGSALYSGAIRSGGIYEFFWSSSDTAWQLGNPQVDYATSAYPGVILLATQAEVDAGTDIPHAVTPSQVASKFSASYATTTSAGLVELATTAETSLGTNVSAVVTPAALRAITNRNLGVVLAVSSGVSTASFLYRTNAASAWTVSVKNTGARHVRVSHGLGIASAGAAIINLQMFASDASTRSHCKIAFWDTDTTSLAFDFVTETTASGPQFLDPSSCNVHIQVML